MEIIKSVQQLGNMNMFSWSELLSDNSGKTSGASFIGVIVGLVGSICFAYSVVTGHLDFTIQSSIMTGLGASLLGVDKIMQPKAQQETLTNSSEK